MNGIVIGRRHRAADHDGFSAHAVDGIDGPRSFGVRLSACIAAQKD